jgi:DnaD/phage-associated family protein
MSTFAFSGKTSEYTSVSNIFIDNHMPKARGEYVKVYLLGLKYSSSGEPGVSSEIMARTLHLLETDVMNAWNYWTDEGVINMSPIDEMGNFRIEFNILSDAPTSNNNINLLKELDNQSIKDMLQDIEKLLGRPLSTKEMTMYLGWIDEYNFNPELILLLIQYCASKGKTDSRYIEKVALSWFDLKVSSVEDAQQFIKKHEDKWINIRKILNYLGMKDAEVMKPQEVILDKWLNTFNFSVEIIQKASDVCFQRINKSDFKYIDGILTSWSKEGIKTLQDVANKDYKKSVSKKSNGNNGTFNNFEQRNYDYEDLEKKLLGWDNND